MKLKIDIETQTFVRFGLVILGFVGALGAVYLARSALLLILIALFLALALNPPVTWLARRMPGKSRMGATALSFLMVVGLIGTVSFLIVPPIVEQTAKFTATVPSLIDKATSQRDVFSNFINQYQLQSAVDEAISNIKTKAADASAQMGGVLVGAVSGTIAGVVNLLFVLVLSFFMLVEGPYWMKKIWALYDDVDRLEEHRNSVEKMYRVVTGYVTGQITVAAIGASATFLVLLIMSAIPSLSVPPNLALPLAVVAFVLALIPMVGTTISGILISLVLLLNSAWAALIFGTYFIVYQQLENNFIAPPIQSKSVQLSVLWILMAVIIGSSVFGLIGGLISIPIAGCLRVLLVDYLDHAKRMRAKDAKKGRLPRLIKKLTES